jgi:hypothetical protein
MNKIKNKYKMFLGISIILVSFFPHNVMSIENIIPDSTRIDWQPGLPDAIPNYPVGVNVKDFGAKGDGQTDDTQSFLSAIDAATTGTAVFIPTGIYKITSTLELEKTIVLRGDGLDNTRLIFDMSSSGGCIKIKKSGGSTWTNILSGYDKGSNSITVSDESLYDIGTFVEIRQDNDPAVFKPGYKGVETWGDASVGQILQVTAKSGQTLTFNNELYYNYNISMNPRIRPIKMITGVGVEDLYLERISENSYGSNIELVNAAYCWIKRIRSERTITAHVFCSRVYRSEIRDNYFFDSFSHNSGGKGYGIRMEARSTDNLIENNIFKRLRHSMVLQLGATGNVFGYNYSKDPFLEEGNNWLLPDISPHGHYPYMNLFEGNVVQRILVDNVHGTNGPTTIFRNRVEKDVSHYLSYTDKFPFIEVGENNPNQNIIGNEIGIEGAFANEPLKLDPSIENSTIVYGNFNYIEGSFFSSNNAGENLPASLYLEEKPEWFGNLPWPIIGGDVSPNSNEIPAQYRYQNNQFVPNPPAPPQNLRAYIRY